MKDIKVLNLIFFLSSIFFLSACGIKNINKDGLTLAIASNELNKSLRGFPINKNLVLANVEIQKPNLFIKKGTQRISASMGTNISAIMLPKIKGTFELSGVPYFHKESSAIYLKDVNIDKLNLPNLGIEENFVKMILSNMSPVIDTIFKNIPIYKIDKNSFKGRFVKDIKIKNEELLVTFGL